MIKSSFCFSDWGCQLLNWSCSCAFKSSLAVYSLSRKNFTLLDFCIDAPTLIKCSSMKVKISENSDKNLCISYSPPTSPNIVVLFTGNEQIKHGLSPCKMRCVWWDSCLYLHGLLLISSSKIDPFCYHCTDKVNKAQIKETPDKGWWINIQRHERTYHLILFNISPPWYKAISSTGYINKETHDKNQHSARETFQCSL